MDKEQEKLTVEIWKTWKAYHDAEASVVRITQKEQGKDIVEVKDLLHKLDINVLKIVNNLPCKTHKEKLNWITWSLRILWGVVIIVGVLGTFFWTIKQSFAGG